LTQEIDGAEPVGAAPSFRGSADCPALLVPLCGAAVADADDAALRLAVSIGR
jgi:hypothetical protein